MPSWCDTNYVIEGPKEDLEKIQNAIKNHKVGRFFLQKWWLTFNFAIIN